MVDTDERQIFVENIIRSKKIQTFEQILEQVSCSEATLSSPAAGPRQARSAPPCGRDGPPERPAKAPAGRSAGGRASTRP